MPKSPDYIMTQTLFDQLCHVSSFNKMNGTTYQEHIVIIAGKRIPSALHDAVRQAKSGDIALEILTKNNIPWSHKYN
jgi:hypothetical protein